LNAFSQQESPKTYNTAGGYFQNSYFNVAISIGQPISSTWINNIILTNGFLQPDTNFSILQQSPITINRVFTSRTSCFDAADGFAFLIVSGGTPPYSYTWSNNTYDDTLKNVTGGTYFVTVTDINNNNTSVSINIPYPNYFEQPIATDTLITNNSASFIWYKITDATQYILRYRTDNPLGEWQYIFIDSSKNSTIATYLSQNTTYQWQLRAWKDNYTYSCFTDIKYFTTQTNSNCNIPGNLSASNITNSSVTLNWDNDSNTIYYLLRYKIKNSENWTYVHTNTNYQNISNLQKNTMYYWQLRRFCYNNYYSEFTPIDSFSTTNKICDTLINLSTQNITKTSAEIIWTYDTNATYYLIRYREISNNWRYLYTNNNIIQLGCFNCDEQYMLKPGTTYEYQIRTFCNNGNEYSSFTNIHSFNTLPLSIFASYDKTICQGESTTLRAIGTAKHYSWSNGDTTISTIISPSTNSTYTVTIYLAGASASDDVVITVLPKINIYAGNDQTICSGDTALIVATGGNNYMWNTLSMNDSIKVTPTNTSTYIVTGAIGLCSNVDTTVVYVNYTPIPSTGPNQNICIGNIANISSTGGTSYSWSTGENTPNITVSPTTNSSYYVTVSNGNCTATDYAIINVYNGIALYTTQNKTICYGENITLIANSRTANSYIWNTGDTSKSINVAPTINSTYYITAYTDEGCSDAKNIIISVQPKINISAGNDTTICNGRYANLYALGAINYKWSTGSINQTIRVMPQTNTTYIVTGYINECSASDEVVVSVVNCKNIPNDTNDMIDNNAQIQYNDDYIIFPNPTYKFINIISNKNTPTNITIYNNLGQIIINQIYYYNNISIDLSNYNPGIYFIRINNQLRKFIKE